RLRPHRRRLRPSAPDARRRPPARPWRHERRRGDHRRSPPAPRRRHRQRRTRPGRRLLRPGPPRRPVRLRRQRRRDRHPRPGDEVLHASGEATFVVAQTGVGKSTYGQNYVLHRIGVRPGPFLGYTVRPLGPDEVLLYVAADRPRQILRSLRRMVSEDDEKTLDDRLVVWRGPLPYVLNQEPRRLLDHVRRLEDHLGRAVREVILDSLKDVALELSKDEGGSGVADAVNHLVGDGR